MNRLELILPFALAFLFVGIWCLVGRVMSLMSGWTELAKRFHFPGRFQGKYYRFQSAWLKSVNFRGSLEMGMNDRGLYLVPMILFRLFHKPLLIPWAEIQAEPFRKFLFKGYCLTFRSFPGITMKINSRTFEEMKEHLNETEGFRNTGWG